MSRQLDAQNHMDRHSQNGANVKGRKIVHYDQIFDEYYFPLRVSGRQVLEFCPYCGEKLPASQRESWFQHIEALGLNPFDPNFKRKIPAAFRSAAWRCLP